MAFRSSPASQNYTTAMPEAHDAERWNIIEEQEAAISEMKGTLDALTFIPPEVRTVQEQKDIDEWEALISAAQDAIAENKAVLGKTKRRRDSLDDSKAHIEGLQKRFREAGGSQLPLHTVPTDPNYGGLSQSTEVPGKYAQQARNPAGRLMLITVAGKPHHVRAPYKASSTAQDWHCQFTISDAASHKQHLSPRQVSKDDKGLSVQQDDGLRVSLESASESFLPRIGPCDEYVVVRNLPMSMDRNKARVVLRGTTGTTAAWALFKYDPDLHRFDMGFSYNFRQGLTRGECEMLKATKQVYDIVFQQVAQAGEA